MILNNLNRWHVILSLINFKLCKYNVRDPDLFYISPSSLKFIFFLPINTLLSNGNNNVFILLQYYIYSILGINMYYI